MKLKIFILILLSSINSYATTSQTARVVEDKKLNAAEFTKKYWKTRDDTQIVISDHLDNIDRVDINNKYFHISYDKKCFSVDTEGCDHGEFAEMKNPIEEHPGLYFTRKKEYTKPDSQKFGTGFSVGISEHEISDESANKIFSSTGKSKVVMIDHLLNTNSFKGRVTSQVFDSYENGTTVRLRYIILCSGKKK